MESSSRIEKRLTSRTSVNHNQFSFEIDRYRNDMLRNISVNNSSLQIQQLEKVFRRTLQNQNSVYIKGQYRHLKQFTQIIFIKPLVFITIKLKIKYIPMQDQLTKIVTQVQSVEEAEG
ncbi:unnamed protein product (macronuclear) [Paramecium tetraurelia]|uniref:Uncharacterized protein n=1 Tax=Paramecium tetraurelia TaxID=5888 RepID=A0C7J9_PARTE|nr:uncharacterized protein GSPATT00035896001 [Paramecium tetraurelia]CAK66766.1 unnamed protein product [Paramecium tetraurelia]|eukprot:XP_001434163.1 hypothetical protein (macronuclear) [Paramecium tetraurelia strain d4-2]